MAAAVGLGRGDPGLQPPRLRAVHHARRHRRRSSAAASAGPARGCAGAVAGRMVAAWLITLPAAGVVGALMWWIGHLIGGLRRRAGRLRAPAARGRRGLPALAPGPGRPAQRQRRVGRRATGRPRPGRHGELRGPAMHNIGFAADSALEDPRRLPAARRRPARPVRAGHPVPGLRRGRRGRGARVRRVQPDPAPARHGGRLRSVSRSCCSACVLGITFIVASGFGKAVSFAHIYPTIVDKH